MDTMGLKFIYFEKATKFCKISTLLLTTVHTVKSKVEILQNFVAFLEYMSFSSKSTGKETGKTHLCAEESKITRASLLLLSP